MPPNNESIRLDCLRSAPTTFITAAVVEYKFPPWRYSQRDEIILSTGVDVTTNHNMALSPTGLQTV